MIGFGCRAPSESLSLFQIYDFIFAASSAAFAPFALGIGSRSGGGHDLQRSVMRTFVLVS